MPSVVVFTGHMLDKPHRNEPRFPAAVEARVSQRIAAELARLKPAAGYASAACGGDILFHEAMLARGAKTNIVLPCPEAEFRKASVDIAGDASWGRRFEDVLRRATTVEILSEQCADADAMASECCNRVILGLAAMCSAEASDKPAVLALWDGRPGDAAGGTHSMVAYSRAHDYPVYVIDELQPNPTAEARLLAKVDKSGLSITRPDARHEQRICAVVFADVVGFSKLEERQMPDFMRHFWGGIKRLLDDLPEPPLWSNTWGDGLHCDFASIGDAGVFALRLQEFAAAPLAAQADLPPLALRVGVHAGPVYYLYDPIVGRWIYTGAHVVRAARIEPTTPPGKVYATQTFAALAAAEGISEFRCRPIGEHALAKSYGTLSLYELNACP